jgi:hypothetical protein
MVEACPRAAISLPASRALEDNRVVLVGMVVAYSLPDWPPGRDCQAWNGEEILNFMGFLLDSEPKLCVGKNPIDDDFRAEELLVVRRVGYLTHLNYSALLPEIQ